MIYYINHEYTTKIIESTQFLSNPTKSMVYYINHEYTTKIIEGRRFLSNPTKSMVHYINHVYTTKMHRRYYTISVLYCSVYHIKINILLCDIINRILLLYIAVVSGIGRYSEQGSSNSSSMRYEGGLCFKKKNSTLDRQYIVHLIIYLVS